VHWSLAAATALLLGSIPSGLWIGRTVRGIDVRAHGSGNLGATNVYRVLGPRWGVLVLLLDGGKGAAAVAAAGALAGSPWGGVLGLVGAVLGHSFSPFAGFRGGKGVAAAAGAWGMLSPVPFLLALAVFALVFALTRIVSAASVSSALLLPLFVVFLGARSGPLSQDPLFWLSLLTALLIVVRHRSNIGRLRRHQERPLIGRGRHDAARPPADAG
jgi:acyl phosphate:glycerol-3-phosphate acyltransferase